MQKLDYGLGRMLHFKYANFFIPGDNVFLHWIDIHHGQRRHQDPPSELPQRHQPLVALRLPRDEGRLGEQSGGSV